MGQLRLLVGLYIAPLKTFSRILDEGRLLVAVIAAVVVGLVPSLGKVLFEDPEYLRGHVAFSAWLCDRLLGDGSRPLDPRLPDTSLEAVGRYATDLLVKKGFEAVKQRGVAIDRVLCEMLRRAESGPVEAREKWTVQSRTLREQCIKELEGALPNVMGRKDG